MLIIGALLAGLLAVSVRAADVLGDAQQQAYALLAPSVSASVRGGGGLGGVVRKPVTRKRADDILSFPADQIGEYAYGNHGLDFHFEVTSKVAKTEKLVLHDPRGRVSYPFPGRAAVTGSRDPDAVYSFSFNACIDKPKDVRTPGVYRLELWLAGAKRGERFFRILKAKKQGLGGPVSSDPADDPDDGPADNDE